MFQEKKITPIMFYHGPLALIGHMTNASFKQWLGILLMTKIDMEHIKIILPQNLRGNTIKEIFYGTLIFQQSSMICIGRHIGGQEPPTWRPKLLFSCILLNVW